MAGETPVAATLAIPIVFTFSHLLSAPSTRAYVQQSDLQVPTVGSAWFPCQLCFLSTSPPPYP